MLKGTATPHFFTDSSGILGGLNLAYAWSRRLFEDWL